MVEVNFLPWRQARLRFYKKCWLIIFTLALSAAALTYFFTRQTTAINHPITLIPLPVVHVKNLTWTYVGFLQLGDSKVAWLKENNGKVVEKRLGDKIVTGKIIDITPDTLTVELTNHQVKKLAILDKRERHND